MGNRRVFRLVAFATLLTAAVTTPLINPAGADTKNVQADADAKVVQASPNANFETAPLAVDRAPLTESYVRFPVSGLTGSVQQATLRLFALNGVKNGPSVYRSDPVWSENGINWNNRPARTSVKLANVGQVPANGGYVDFDVTAVVTGNDTYSFNIVPDSRDDLQFNSKEAATNKPLLFITLSAPDSAPPNTTINSGPSGTVRADSVSFTFSSSEANSTFQCSLDGASFALCSSPKTYTYPVLSNGLHTFDVRAIDPAGNVDPTAANQVFTVDPNAPGDPVLVGAGDIASCASTGDEATAALLDSIDGTVFTTGDNVYDTGTAAEFTNCYNPSWGRHKSRTRPATGNHDYATANASGYYGYFGPAAGDPAKGYYSYNLGAWHVIVLNSTCSAVGGCGAGSPQDQWLRADLAASNAACTVAMWHHPLFSSGTVHGGDTTYVNFWQALYENGADVVLAGHDHMYERFGLQTATGAADIDFGLRQFTVGTGGRSHYASGTPLANSQVINSATFGVMKLTLHANSYDWQFVPEAGKTFTDTGTASCHGAPSVSPPPPPPPPPPPSSGPVAFRAASSSGSNVSRSTITITKPTGTVAGDVMICSIVENDVVPVSPPAGWTLVRQDAVGTALTQAVFVRVAGASEPSSYTWSLNNNLRRIAGGISTYSGVDTAQPIDAHNGATDSVGSTSIIAPSVTTTTDGAMVLHLAAINAEGTISPPPGSSERWENTGFNPDNTRDALGESSDFVQAGAGATGNRTATASLPGRYVGVLLALRPAP